MPSIAEILDQDIDQEKTASVKKTESKSSDVVKIAQELDLFNDLFPEDRQTFNSQEKTAEQEKVAYAEKLGQRAHA